MRLNEKERRIFGAVHFNPDAPLTKVAFESGFTERTVRRTLASLTEREVIQTSLILDESRLGIKEYGFYFSTNSNAGVKLSQVEAAIISKPCIWWLSRTLGEYQYEGALCVREFTEIEKFFDEITAELGLIFSAKLLSRRAGWFYFGKKYLLRDQRSITVHETGLSAAQTRIDTTDLRLISYLCDNPMASTLLAARQLDIPSSSAAARVSKLRRSGVLGPPLHRMRVSTSGLSSFSLILKTTFPSLRERRRLFKYSKEHRHIVELCSAEGDYDYVLAVEAPDICAIHALTADLRRFFPHWIESLWMYQRLDDLKWRADLRSLIETRPDTAGNRSGRVTSPPLDIHR